jgi:hypothetical protein
MTNYVVSCFIGVCFLLLYSRFSLVTGPLRQNVIKQRTEISWIITSCPFTRDERNIEFSIYVCHSVGPCLCVTSAPVPPPLFTFVLRSSSHSVMGSHRSLSFGLNSFVILGNLSSSAWNCYLQLETQWSTSETSFSETGDNIALHVFHVLSFYRNPT